MKKINRQSKTTVNKDFYEDVLADEFETIKKSFKKPASKKALSVDVPKGMEIDFDKLVKPSDYINITLTILEVSKISTSYGEKTVIKVEEPGNSSEVMFMYCTDSMTDVYDRFLDGKITTVTPLRKASNQSKNSYVTYKEKFDRDEDETPFTNLEVISGKNVIIHEYKLIDTKYGKKYLCEGYDPSGDYIKFLVSDSWSRLFREAERKYSVENIKECGLEVTITPHVSEKTGNTYYLYR